MERLVGPSMKRLDEPEYHQTLERKKGPSLGQETKGIKLSQ